MLYSYSFSNRKRDLSDILSSVIKDEPRFISNFRCVPDARVPRHEWLEDQLPGRGIIALKCKHGLLYITEGEAAKLRVGTLLCKKDDPALFVVTDFSNSLASVELAASNGSALTVETLPPEGATFNIVSTPTNDNDTPAEPKMQSSWNATQIFRKEIVLSGTALAVNLYGGADSQLNRQTAFALSDLARDLNRVALFGRRVEGDAAHPGEAGGLYYFATGAAAPEIDAGGIFLTSGLLNDAVLRVCTEGGEPQQLLCSPGQARVISNEFRERLQVLRSDDRRGAYVAVIVNEINGRGLTIMADPDVPDTDAWVLDPAGFGLANLKGRAIADKDATPRGFDGIRRTALGELTFEFRNVHQRCCRIKNLMSSIDAGARSAYPLQTTTRPMMASMELNEDDGERC
jgi:hypothetical protein